MKSEFLNALADRGLIKDTTGIGELDKMLRQPNPRAYIGFDMTADSLHVGSLIQIMILRWMVRYGVKPYILLGGATTRIGDPTGKDSMRPALTSEQIEANQTGIQKVFDRLVLRQAMAASFERFPMVVNNEHWLQDVKLMDYLRDFGPHFTINRMMAMESVKQRLDRAQPMTFLEFNYMLFQAIDFRHLFKSNGVRLQVGGSDQWGNIVNGVELVRRMDGETVHGLTTPLMTNSAGQKMGKTASGAVWLSEDKTSVFDFWQFWRNVEDAKVSEFLRMFTELDLSTIRTVCMQNPNEAKEILATEVTTIVHGQEAALKAQETAREFMRTGVSDSLPTIQVSLSEERLTVGFLAVLAGLCSSRGDAARMAKNGGLRFNGKPIGSEESQWPLVASLGETITLAVGKKKAVKVEFTA